MKRGAVTFVVFAVLAVGYTITRDRFDATPTSTTTVPSNVNCSTRQVTTSWVDGSGAAGTVYAWVKITNTSNSRCSLPAWPSVEFLDASNSSLPSDLSRQNSDGLLLDWNQQPINVSNVGPIDLPPGSSAALALSFLNDSSCSLVSKMTLSWSGASVSVAPHYLVSSCNGPGGLISPLFLAP